MNNNVCIILLIFLIVYLIYKISSNSCDYFSVGGQTCNGFTKSACDAGQRAYKCEWNASTEKCEQRMSKITLRPENPSEFLAKIKETYKNPNSNGVFISMFVNKGQMDASGSVLKKTYNGVFGETCNFGFIWDIDWLDKNLVECLFPRDAGTAYFDDDDCNQTIKTTNFCELANTSSSNTPDRCSHGLLYSNNIPPYPTNCNQKIKYDLKTFSRDSLGDKNCFTYINDIHKNMAYPGDYNEGVFLKDIPGSIPNFNIGFKKLYELNKPLPVALLYVYNPEINCLRYNKNMMKVLKLNFSEDTVVIRITSSEKSGKTVLNFLDADYKTLDEIPGY